MGSYRYDVFISYAAANNDLPSPCDRWVSRLVDGLGKALRARMDGNRCTICFDERTIEPNQTLENLLDSARQSRVFIAISSSAYNTRPWPKRELDAFLEATNDSSRLFMIELEPVSTKDRWPALQGRPRCAFHHEVKTGSSSVPAPLEPDSKLFFQPLWDLATSIAARLKALPDAEPAPATFSPFVALPPSVPPMAATRTVLLAQVTEDLASDYASLRRALEQFPSVRLLPSDGYPQAGDRFREAFRADLAEADFVLQLLSTTPGRTPPDLPIGYVRCQAEDAEAAAAQLIQWRRSDLRLADVEDETYRALLQRPTVIASTFPSFLKYVIDQVTAPIEPVAARPDNDGRGLVFVNADKRDLAPAKQCGTLLADEFNVILPPEEEEEKGESVQEALNAQLESCDAMLLFQGSSGAGWVRAQLFQAMKIRGWKRRLPGAVLHGPPNGRRPINMLIQGVEELDCTSEDGAGWRFDAVREFVSKTHRV